MLIYEAGEALRFDETGIRAGIRGIVNVMRHIGMLPKAKKPARVKSVVTRSTHWVRAVTSGIVANKVPLGSSVTRGQRLATISDPLGEEEESVLAPNDGIVIGRSNLPLAHEGDALFHLGYFEELPAAENIVESFAATASNLSKPG
jgi:predicted deacylase